MNDLKFAIRQLLKNPGFTAVAVLTLALGIGANTALFSFVNAILLQPLPYREADRLVTVTREFKREGRSEWREAAFDPDIRQWREQNQMFEQLAAYNQGAFSVQTGDAAAVRVPGIRATSEFLSALGVSPFLGRNFSSADELSNGADSVLISHRFWVSQFASAPD